MVEDTPDDLVHELFTQGFWEDHPLGRPILGTRERSSRSIRTSFACTSSTHIRPRTSIVVGGGQPGRTTGCATSSRDKFGSLVCDGRQCGERAPRRRAAGLIRNKELEQSHVCLGASSYPQNHDDRYASYVLNTLLGGSMSSRLFQNVREKRGLAYAVFSGLTRIATRARLPSTRAVRTMRCGRSSTCRRRTARHEDRRRCRWPSCSARRIT